MNVMLVDEAGVSLGEVSIGVASVPPKAIVYGTQLFLHMDGLTYRRSPFTIAQAVALPLNLPTEEQRSQDPGFF